LAAHFANDCLKVPLEIKQLFLNRLTCINIQNVSEIENENDNDCDPAVEADESN
jgi:hypothetical protein